MPCLFLLEVERVEFEPEPGVEKSSREGSIKKTSFLEKDLGLSLCKLYFKGPSFGVTV